MCSVTVANAIVQMMQQMVANEEVFTAYDITIAVRAIESDTVPHRDVRTVVHNSFDAGEMTNYQSALCTLDLQNDPTAVVFYPNGKNPSDHPLVEDDTQSSVTSSDANDSDSSDDSTDADIYSVTAEGRINIPKKVLDQVTPIGNSFDFMINGSVKCRSINSDGRIRFSMADLGFTGSKCRVIVDSIKNTINLEQA